MSTVGIVWLSIAAYVGLGIGTARAVLARAMKIEVEHYGHHSVVYSDPNTVMPMILGGVFWPVALVYLLVVRPLVKVVGPGFVQWFRAPSERVLRTYDERTSR